MSSLENVREGMDVVDSTGEKVGTVKFVKMGDLEAITAEGQTAGDRESLVDVFIDAFAGRNDVPEQARERFLRLGYIDVDATGIGGDFYVAADEVADVTGTTVQLSAQRSDQ